MLGDHVAEHLEGAAVDARRTGQPEDVLGSPIGLGAMRVDRKSGDRSLNVHQLHRHVAHGLRVGDATEHVRRAHRRFHSGDAATQSISHSIVVCAQRRDLVDRLGEQHEVLCHGRHLLQTVGAALNGAVLVVERITQHGPAGIDLTEAVSVVDAHIAVVRDVGAVAVDGAQRLDLDTRRVQRNQEHGQALMLRRGRIGVGDQEYVGGVLRVGGEHLRAVDDPAVPVAHRARLAGRDVGSAVRLGVAKAQPDPARQGSLHHLVFELGRAEIPHCPCDHRRRAPVEPRCMGPADLEIPEPATEATEATVGLVVELGRQVARLAEGEVNPLVEVLAGLAVSPDDLIGDEGLQ